MFGKDRVNDPYNTMGTAPRRRNSNSGDDDTSPVAALKAGILRQNRNELARLEAQRESAARWGRPVRDLDARISEVRGNIAGLES